MMITTCMTCVAIEVLIRNEVLPPNTNLENSEGTKGERIRRSTACPVKLAQNSEEPKEEGEC